MHGSPVTSYVPLYGPAASTTWNFDAGADCWPNPPTVTINAKAILVMFILA